MKREPYLGFENSKSQEKQPDFDFTAAEVIKTLSPSSESKPIEYVGSGLSHFQAEPLFYGPDGKPVAVSDWEYEVVRQSRGGPSGIPKAEIGELPAFLPKKEDYINRSKELGENMFRFSLDFARLCPEPGEFNEELMADYVKALALIKARGQEPFLTLHHFTMPKYLLEFDRDGNISAGGWEHPDVAKHFRFYMENVIKFLGDEDKIKEVLRSQNFSKDAQDKFLAEASVKYFLTINEPLSVIFGSYLAGIFPPYKRGNILVAKKVLDKLVEAHDVALDEIKGGLKQKKGEPQVGVGYNWQYYDGIMGRLVHEFDEYSAKKFERDGARSDFLGLHYYFRMAVPSIPGRKKKADYSDRPMFGDVYPPGLFEVIKQMHSAYPRKQIFISEFGFSDKNDLRRPYWILETVRYILEAKKQGLPIKGMLLWSFTNNFEWELGMSQKFGLFNEADLKRPLVPSTKGIRSWEVWQAAAKAILSPTPEALENLQKCYETAYKQYKAAGGKY